MAAASRLCRECTGSSTGRRSVHPAWCRCWEDRSPATARARTGVLHTTAGVRALVRHGGSESSVSRLHRIVDGPPVGPPGVVSVLGGKITGYRAIAEDVTDVVCKRLGAAGRTCSTAERP